MADYEKIKEISNQSGGKDWMLLADAVQDQEFLNILTTAEKDIFIRISDNPNTIRDYHDQSANIVSKYISWKIYKDSKFKALKNEVNELSKEVSQGRNELKVISDAAKYIGGATVLVEYSKSFSKRACEHGENADTRFKYYMCSLVFFLLIVVSIFTLSISDSRFLKSYVADDIAGFPLNTAFFVLKAALLYFTFQFVQFFRKNYGAEKHLEEVYRHRSDVLQSLNAVYNALSDTGEKDKILSAGALFAYERGETGYITTKEGAGSSDDLIGGLFNRIFK